MEDINTIKNNLTVCLYRLVAVVRNIQLKRSLNEICPEPNLNFWRIIYGNFLDVAVLEWCKVFGNDAEETHWKNVVIDHDQFREYLYEKLNITENEWSMYWMELKRYRDNQAAHYNESERIENYPDMELALKSSYCCYDHLIKHLRALGETRYPDDLEQYSIKFLASNSGISAKAIGATKDIKEEVY